MGNSTGYKHTTDAKRRISRATKNQWLNSSFRKKMSRLVSEQNRKRWQDLAYRKKMSKQTSRVSKRNWENPGFRKLRSNSVKKQWKNPEYRKLMLTAIKKRCEGIEFKNSRRNILKNQWQDPIFRKKVSAGVSKAGVIRWGCLAYREKMARCALKMKCAHPNKFETRALAYLERIYSSRFSYCGDGSVLINGRSADAIDTKTRTVVLLNGVYWHLKKRGLVINNQNKRLRERIEAVPFLKAGYRVLFIWEDELNDITKRRNYDHSQEGVNICH